MDFNEFLGNHKVRLNDQQKAAVLKTAGPVLLLAVPGSGKTTTLISRLGYMIKVCGIPPEQILTMTYTVAAARDMKQRFVSVFGDEDAKHLEFRTINGVCSKIIRTYEWMYGRTAFDIVTSDQQAAIAGAAYRKINKEYANEGTIKALLLKIAFVKNSMLKKEERKKVLDDDIAHFSDVYDEYSRILTENRLMDYDDQMRYAYSILIRFPDVLQKVQNRFKYICVDEAQDTSKIQHRIIQLLAWHTKNLFMVGDEDQSIYGFRAAYPEALMDFEKTYPGATVLLLEQNFRSTPQITKAADLFIRQNTARHDKTIRATRKDGLPIGSIYATSRQDQYDQLVSLARTCKTQTAILYRNNESAIPLIDQLDREGIPFRCRGMDSLFFVNRVVRDLCDILHLSINPFDGEVFERVYYKLKAGITKEVAKAAVMHSKETGKPILDCIMDMPSAPKYTRRQTKERSLALRFIKDKRADKALIYIWNEWYGSYSDDHPGSTEKYETLKLLGAFQKDPQSLLVRLDELNEIITAGTMDQDCPLILSTIHSSKGLEYERVILIDVIDGIFPQKVPVKGKTMEKADLEELEEDRRIFYVGLTRAKDELMIIRFTQKGMKTELTSCFTDHVFATQKMQKLGLI